MEETKRRGPQFPKYPGVYRVSGSRILHVVYSWRGERFRESAQTESVREAYQLRLERLAALKAGTFSGPQQDRVTVATVLEAYVENRKLAGKAAIRDIVDQCRRLAIEFGPRLAIDLSLPFLERWANQQLETGAARATVKTRLAYLRAAFKLARRHGLIARVLDVPLIQVDNARQGFFEADEADAVEAAMLVRSYKGRGLVPRPHGEMLRDLIRFQRLSGWRTAECLALPWAWVKRQEREIVLPSTGTTKRRQDRILPLDYHLDTGEWANCALWQLIERRWAARKVGPSLCLWVFHRDGRPVKDWDWAWRSACVIASVNGRIRHDFRRTRVRDLINAGVPEKVAMAWTGHRTRAIFDRYHIVTSTDERKALAKILPLKDGFQPQFSHSEGGLRVGKA